MKKNKTNLAPELTTNNKLKNIMGILILLFSFALYAQSIYFDYALDDTNIVQDNNLVKKGFSAIPTLLTTDALYGMNEESVRAAGYRPIPMIMLAIEWQIAPNNPHFYHLFHILVFAIACWVLFLLLCTIFSKWNLIVPFVCTLLFVAHPVHTEVVDNIKSLDELLSFLFSILSMLLLFRFVEKKSTIRFVFAGLCFFLALLSKETAITFLLIIPLSLFVFSNAPFKKILTIAAALIGVTLVFFLIRYEVLKAIPADQVKNLLSPDFNSILAAPDFAEQKATAFYILLRYAFLLIFPYQLAYDYSIAQIPIQQMTSPGALMGIVFYFAMGIYAIIKIRKKDVIAFAILFYLITLAPVSNLFLTIPWTMGERFLFMPSLGFCILITLLLIRITKTEIIKSKFKTFSQLLKMNIGFMAIVLVFLGLYSFKTIERNPDWKNNTTLFSHDVKVVPNNAFAHINYGSVIMYTLCPAEKNIEQQKVLIENAILEFEKAVAIYPKLSDAYSNLGVAHTYMADYKNSIGDVMGAADNYNSAIKNYEAAIPLFHPTPPSYIYCDLGMLYCKTGQYDKAISILDSSLRHYPSYTDAYTKKCFAYLSQGRNEEAIAECDKQLIINPKEITAYINKGYGYSNLKQYEKAIENLNIGLEIDPMNVECLQLLQTAYQNIGDVMHANQCIERLNILRN